MQSTSMGIGVVLVDTAIMVRNVPFKKYFVNY